MGGRLPNLIYSDYALGEKLSISSTERNDVQVIYNLNFGSNSWCNTASPGSEGPAKESEIA